MADKDFKTIDEEIDIVDCVFDGADISTAEKYVASRHNKV